MSSTSVLILLFFFVVLTFICLVNVKMMSSKTTQNLYELWCWDRASISSVLAEQLKDKTRPPTAKLRPELILE